MSMDEFQLKSEKTCNGVVLLDRSVPEKFHRTAFIQCSCRCDEKSSVVFLSSSLSDSAVRFKPSNTPCYRWATLTSVSEVSVVLRIFSFELLL